MKPSGENQPQNEESLDEVNINHLPVSLPLQHNSLPNTEVGKDSAGSGETNPSEATQTKAKNSDNASPGETHPIHKQNTMIGIGLIFLYLFAGPLRPEDGFAAFCQKFGAKVEMYDKLLGHNLVDSTEWSERPTFLYSTCF